MYADEHRGRRSWSLQHGRPTSSSDSSSVVSSDQIAPADRDRSRAPIFVHVIHVDHERVWAHRACWLLAVALLFSCCSLSGCAPGARSTATLRATPTASPTARPTPTYPPCDGATQWQPPAGNIALDALSMVSPDEGWATGEVNPDLSAFLPDNLLFRRHPLPSGQRPVAAPAADLSGRRVDIALDGFPVRWPGGVGSPVTGGTNPLVLHYANGAWQPVDILSLDIFLPPNTNGGGRGPPASRCLGRRLAGCSAYGDQKTNAHVASVAL